MSEQTYYPVVIVPGIGQSKVVEVNEAGEALRTVWPLSFDTGALIDKMKGPFMKMMLFRRDGGFSDAAAEAVADAADGIASNPDGSMKHTLRAVTYPYPLSECTADEKRYIYKMAPVQSLGETLGEDRIFFFAYNSFGMPYEIAADLRAFVDMVRERTGSDKVSFLPLSLGGAMLTAYLDAYGAADIYRIVYMVPALQGTRTISDVFRKDLRPGHFASVLEQLVGGGTAQKLGAVFSMLPEGVGEKTADKVTDALLKTILTGSGAMWACLPPEYYTDLAETYLADGAHAALRAQTDRFHKAQTALRDTLQALSAQGVGIYICACYGLKLAEALGSAGACSSDGVIHIESASLGATAAVPGETLPEDKIRSRAYLSPDGALDASTGAFPDSTWYFAGQYHDSIAYNDTALEVARRALSDESFTDIRSDPALGQFQPKQDNRDRG